MGKKKEKKRKKGWSLMSDLHRRLQSTSDICSAIIDGNAKVTLVMWTALTQTKMDNVNLKQRT